MSIRKIILLLIVLIGLSICFNLGSSIYSLWHKKDVLALTKMQLIQAQQQNRQLKVQLSQVSDPSFVEQLARNKLFLIKPGEQNVVVPQTIPVASGDEHVVSAPVKPSWQQWWELFY